MIAQERVYQAVTFALVAAAFDFLERYRPGFSVSRQKELPLNVLALLVVMAGGELWKTVLLSGCQTFGISKAFPSLSLTQLPGPLKVLLAITLGDFCLYWVHRAMHRPFLWRTHAFHHSIGEIWWLAGSRTSVTHLFLFAVPQVLIAYEILPLSPLEIGVTFSFGVVVNLWIHTNLWVNWGPLEWLLITPNFHRIHHGARGFANSNLGFVFTVWDKMFGTYVDPRATGKGFALFPAPTGRRLFRMLIGF